MLAGSERFFWRDRVRIFWRGQGASYGGVGAAMWTRGRAQYLTLLYSILYYTILESLYCTVLYYTIQYYTILGAGRGAKHPNAWGDAP